MEFRNLPPAGGLMSSGRIIKGVKIGQWTSGLPSPQHKGFEAALSQGWTQERF